MKKKTWLLVLISTTAVLLSWPLARLMSQISRESPVELADRSIVVVENRFGKDGSVIESYRETLAMTASGVMKHTRAVVLPVNPVDDTYNRVTDFANNADFVWMNNVPRIRETKAHAGKLRLADFAADWTATKCGLIDALNPAPSDRPGVSHEFLGEQTLYGGVLAYGTKSVDKDCEDCAGPESQSITNISWRSPQFACQEVASSMEIVFKDGTTHLAAEKRVVSAKPLDLQGTLQVRAVPTNLQRASRAEIIREQYRSALGRDWPQTPEERLHYDRLVEADGRRGE